MPINVFPGAGAAAGFDELNISATMGVGLAAAPVQKLGLGTLILSGSGANAYSGQTTVDQGTLVLAKTAAAYAGPLVVGNYGSTPTVRVLSNTNQLNSQAVIVNAGGTFNMAPGSAVQTVNLTGATAGTFTLSLTVGANTGTTGTIAFNASAAQVQAALAAMLAAAPFNFANAATDVLVAGGGAASGMLRCVHRVLPGRPGQPESRHDDTQHGWPDRRPDGQLRRVCPGRPRLLLARSAPLDLHGNSGCNTGRGTHADGPRTRSRPCRRARPVRRIVKATRSAATWRFRRPIRSTPPTRRPNRPPLPAPRPELPNRAIP